MMTGCFSFYFIFFTMLWAYKFQSQQFPLKAVGDNRWFGSCLHFLNLKVVRDFYFVYIFARNKVFMFFQTIKSEVRARTKPSVATCCFLFWKLDFLHFPHLKYIIHNTENTFSALCWFVPLSNVTLDNHLVFKTANVSTMLVLANN